MLTKMYQNAPKLYSLEHASHSEASYKKRTEKGRPQWQTKTNCSQTDKLSSNWNSAFALRYQKQKMCSRFLFRYGPSTRSIRHMPSEVWNGRSPDIKKARKHIFSQWFLVRCDDIHSHIWPWCASCAMHKRLLCAIYASLAPLHLS